MNEKSWGDNPFQIYNIMNVIIAWGEWEESRKKNTLDSDAQVAQLCYQHNFTHTRFI